MFLLYKFSKADLWHCLWKVLFIIGKKKIARIRAEYGANKMWIDNELLETLLTAIKLQEMIFIGYAGSRDVFGVKKYTLDIL